MRLRLVTDSTNELVLPSEAKAHLRVDNALDDAYITTLCLVARKHLEKMSSRALLNQTWELTRGRFPLYANYDDAAEDEGVIIAAIELPRGQLQSITSFQYIDINGTLQTVDPTIYDTDTKNHMGGRVILGYQQVWPITRYIWNAVTLTFVAGYGLTADLVPAPIKQAALILIAAMFEYRTPEITGTIIAKVGFSVGALMADYRLPNF